MMLFESFRIRKITHKMMAAVSELSMYQATAMKLEQERLDKEQLLSQVCSSNHQFCDHNMS
jgi:hypothetical protein